MLARRLMTSMKFTIPAEGNGFYTYGAGNGLITVEKESGTAWFRFALYPSSASRTGRSTGYVSADRLAVSNRPSSTGAERTHQEFLTPNFDVTTPIRSLTTTVALNAYLMRDAFLTRTTGGSGSGATFTRNEWTGTVTGSVTLPLGWGNNLVMTDGRAILSGWSVPTSPPVGTPPYSRKETGVWFQPKLSTSGSGTYPLEAVLPGFVAGTYQINQVGTGTPRVDHPVFARVTPDLSVSYIDFPSLHAELNPPSPPDMEGLTEWGRKCNFYIRSIRQSRDEAYVLARTDVNVLYRGPDLGDVEFQNATGVYMVPSLNTAMALRSTLSVFRIKSDGTMTLVKIVSQKTGIWTKGLSVYGAPGNPGLYITRNEVGGFYPSLNRTYISSVSDDVEPISLTTTAIIDMTIVNGGVLLSSSRSFLYFASFASLRGVTTKTIPGATSSPTYGAFTKHGLVVANVGSDWFQSVDNGTTWVAMPPGINRPLTSTYITNTIPL
ncbi:hypothetical protein [Agrobacterium sp.]|uniref:hypothetical protein n=1 Tax=Agrobacterium sp. TaxID=361 RepID=UPI000DB3C956|nr:hypothetical protein [Agrobacterium sp.]PZU78185.1 MAG: hypothetical protein DI546_04295 [Rhizobium sp.]